MVDTITQPKQECICPLVGKPCIGKGCCEFVPRHTYIGEMGYGIQDFVVYVWRWIRKKPHLDMTYTGTICAHCRKDYRSAYRYDKKELTEDWAKWNHK